MVICTCTTVVFVQLVCVRLWCVRLVCVQLWCVYDCGVCTTVVCVRLWCVYDCGVRCTITLYGLIPTINLSHILTGRSARLEIDSEETLRIAKMVINKLWQDLN